MRSTKQTVILGILGVLVLGGVIAVGVQTRAQLSSAPKSPLFDDVGEIPEWAEGAVIALAERGVLPEDEREYRPGDPLTRGQILLLVYRDLRSYGFVGAPLIAACPTFTDIDEGTELQLAACTFWLQGWIAKSAEVLPETPVTRGEIAGLLGHVFGPSLLTALGTDTTEVLTHGPVFSDVSPEHPAFVQIAVLHRLGIMTGEPAFGVDEPVNRAAFALILEELNRRMEDEQVPALEGFDVHAHEGGGRVESPSGGVL